MVLGRGVRSNRDHAQRIDPRVELAAKVIDRLDLVHQREIAGFVEENFDDVALGRRNYDTLDQFFTFEQADVGAHQLHHRAAEGEIERPRVRDVGQEKTYDGTTLHFQAVMRLPIDQQQVAESTHKRLYRALLTEWEQPSLVDQQIVQHDRFLPVHRAEVVGCWMAYQHVAVETHVLLDVDAHVRMVPVDSRVRKVDGVGEALARLHGLLCYTRHSIRAIIDPHTVPMHRGGKIDLVDEVNDDGRVPVDLDERTRVLTVEAVHHERPSAERAAHEHGRQVERVAIREPLHFSENRFWQ